MNVKAASIGGLFHSAWPDSALALLVSLNDIGNVLGLWRVFTDDLRPLG
jgi:hypothetical protein